MAEGQQNTAQRFLSWINPIPRIQDRFAGFRDHPVQSGVSTALGMVPLAGPVLSGLSRLLFQNRNNGQTNDAMEASLRDQNQQLSNQIFPPNGPSQGGMARPPQSMGSMGPPGGMAGITSPLQGQSSQQSPLLQMLGIPDYANGTPTQGAPQAQPQAPSMGVPAQSYGGGFGASTSLGSNGATVGTMSMNQLSEMLNAGVGQNNRAAQMTPVREMSEMRDAQRNAGNKRAPGQSVRDFLMQ